MLSSATDRLPVWEKVAPFSSMDALAVHQLTAPGVLLGVLGETAALKAEHCLAVTEGDVGDEISALQSLLADVESGAEMRFSTDPDRVVEFRLDLPDFPVWTGLGYVNEKPVFNLQPWIR